MQELKTEPQTEPTEQPSGFQQSPIDILSRESFAASEKLNPSDYLQCDYPGSVKEDHGHSRFELDATQFKIVPSLKFRSIEAKLASVHFHARSEHWIDGADFEAEFHFVHLVDSEEKQAGKHAQEELPKYLVIGVPVDIEEDEEACAKYPQLQQLLLNLRPGVDKEQIKEVKALDREIFEQAFDQFHSYYHYRGSLTTGPDEKLPFEEKVYWFVLQNPIKLPEKIIRGIADIEQRTRCLQPLNRRIILSCKSKS